MFRKLSSIRNIENWFICLSGSMNMSALNDPEGSVGSGGDTKALKVILREPVAQMEKSLKKGNFLVSIPQTL